MQAADINALFGFRMECIERLGEKQGVFAWNRINSMFNWLPLAALIEDRIICMHGGENSQQPYPSSIFSIYRNSALSLLTGVCRRGNGKRNYLLWCFAWKDHLAVQG